MHNHPRACPVFSISQWFQIHIIMSNVKQPLHWSGTKHEIFCQYILSLYSAFCKQALQFSLCKRAKHTLVLEQGPEILLYIHRILLYKHRRLLYKHRRNCIILSSPGAESARAVTGRRCPHSGRGEDFLTGRLNFFTETAVTPEQKVEKSFPRSEINRHAEG